MQRTRRTIYFPRYGFLVKQQTRKNLSLFITGYIQKRKYLWLSPILRFTVQTSNVRKRALIEFYGNGCPSGFRWFVAKKWHTGTVILWTYIYTKLSKIINVILIVVEFAFVMIIQFNEKFLQDNINCAPSKFTDYKVRRNNRSMVWWQSFFSDFQTPGQLSTFINDAKTIDRLSIKIKNIFNDN